MAGRSTGWPSFGAPLDQAIGTTRDTWFDRVPDETADASGDRDRLGEMTGPDRLPHVRELLSPEGLRDPYAVYTRFREAEAAGHDIGDVVVRYDQVVRLLGDRRLSAGRVNAILEPLGAQTRDGCPLVARTLKSIVAFRDPPDHARIRAVLSPSFSSRVAETASRLIAELSTRLLDTLEGEREVDLHRVYSYPLPALVVGALLGIPEAELDRFRTWARDIVWLVGSGTPTPELAAGAEAHFAEMRAYLGALARDQRRTPGRQLLSLMIHGDGEAALSEDEIFANATFLMTAGHETATNMLSNGVVSLLRHPDQLWRLRRDRTLIDSAIEEILRFESPVQMTARVALADGEFAGRSVRAGDSLRLFLGAANRDPSRFPDPGRFDVTRDDNRHVAFGFGPHFCLGAALAREELRIALNHLLDRLPGLELTVDEVRWQPTIDFRGPVALPVRWGGRA